MEQLIFGGEYDLLNNAVTEYNSLIGATSWGNIEGHFAKVVSTDGVIKNLRVVLSGSPGAGKKYAFTLLLNGAPTALTFDIAGLDTSGSNTVNEIDVTGGNTISIQCVPTGTPTARYATWSSIFKSDVEKESLILGGSSNTLDGGAIEYAQIMGAYTILSNIENSFRQVVPTGGRIKNLYVKLDQKPGTGAGDAYRFTVRLNKASPANGLVVTITQPSTTGNDLINGIDVVAGDILTMMVEPLSGPSAAPYAQWGMTFVSGIDGESIVLGGSYQYFDASLTNYQYLTGREGSTWTTEEYQRYQLGQVCVLNKLYMLTSGAPGVGKSYIFTLRIAGANSKVVVTISGAATTGNSGALEDTVALNDYVDLQVVPTGTPSVYYAYWGFVCYIAPGWGGKVLGIKSPDDIIRVCGVLINEISKILGVEG